MLHPLSFTIRPEQPNDFSEISELVKNAFATAEYSDHQEHLLIERLRQDNAFLPELALIAENHDGVIIGHIMFSEAWIGDKDNGCKVWHLLRFRFTPIPKTWESALL